MLDNYVKAARAWCVSKGAVRKPSLEIKKAICLAGVLRNHLTPEQVDAIRADYERQMRGE